MQYRDEVLYIIENEPEETWQRVNPTDRWLTLTNSRNKRLMDLRGGQPYRYMFTHFYPQLRHGSVITIYTQRVLPIPLEIKPIETTHQQLTLPEREPIPVESIHSLPFAVKTNLLYDLALTPNVEIEIPLGNRWSVAGEWIFPWWVTKDNGNALEILSGQVEGRFWLGNRNRRALLTGWFAGLYAGGGLYDLQYQNNGYQGEFYIAAGVSAGYAHTVNKSGSLRMEYTVGLGYLSTNYRYYEGKQDNEYLVWQYDGSYTWLGPTKVEISLVWFIDLKWQKGGKR
ncbi:MAG: DUF3575 domain-containing protein [Bacteroidales bacterium]